MALQYFLLAFLALQGVSAHTHSVAHPETQVDLHRGLIEEFDKLIQQLKEAVAQAIAQVKEIIKQIYDELSEEIKQALEEALKKLAVIWEQVLAELKKLEEEAAALGEAALKCVQDQKANIVDLSQKTLEANQACVATLQVAADALRAEGEAVIKAAVGKVSELLTKWNECTNVLCWIGVINDARTAIPEIIASVQAFVPKVAEFIQTDVVAFHGCIDTNLQAHAEGMAVIIGDVKTCIDAIGSA